MKILLMGREDLITELLARFFEDEGFEIIALEKEPEKVIEIIPHTKPDIVLIDANKHNGKRPSLLIKSLFPKQKIVVLSHLDQEEDVLPVLAAGVEGYLLKSSHPKEILENLIAVHNGLIRVSPQLYDFILKDWHKKEKKKRGEPSNELTARELEVLNLIAEGKTNKEISKILSISSNTVKCHVSSIISKLDAKSRTDAVFKSYNLVKNSISPNYIYK
jgi:two-component system NarL family response regulator